MSEELPLVSQVMYLREGVVEPGDEAKEEQLERKILDWKRDIVDRVGKELPTPSRDEMVSDMVQVENNLEGYWCEGDKCVSSRTHWVLHSSETICWDCRHDPCACLPPLVWDETEQAYYRFLKSCDGKTKNNIWLLEPTSDLARISFKRKEKKQRDNMKKRRKEECADNQQSAQDEGCCCHHHAKSLKVKDEEERNCTKRAKVDGPDHCIHCNEDFHTN
jgi:hypothetical protein